MSEDLNVARFTVRAIAGGRTPDQVLECLECGALVTFDSGVMHRHLAWHERINRTVP